MEHDPDGDEQCVCQRLHAERVPFGPAAEDLRIKKDFRRKFKCVNYK